MSKRRRGMSAQEKRETMQRILFDSAEVFNLKELESLGRKAGVVVQAIKDVIQSLVDDDLIEMEKIGSSNFFWAFPSKTSRILQNKIEAAKTSIASEEQQIAALTAQRSELLASRTVSDERTAQLAELQALLDQQRQLDAQLETMKMNDPEVLKEMGAKVQVAKDAANRWTDNVWQLKSYLVKKRGMAARDVDRALQLPEDFDYVE